MKVNEINLLTSESRKATGVVYNYFPDGEVGVEVHGLNQKYPVKIISRICSSTDLFILMQISDIIKRKGLYVNAIIIPYLMSARTDRVFSPDHPFTLSIVADVINSLNAELVEITEAHSLRATQLIKNSYSCPPHILGTLLNNPNIIRCFPDEGAMKRYNTPLPSLCCEKVRGKNGEVDSIEIMNASILKHVEPNTPIVVIDDLCDGGGTFIRVRKAIESLSSVGSVSLFVTHMVQWNGIFNVAQYYNTVTFTDSYRNWIKYADIHNTELPFNVNVECIYEHE